MKDAAGPVDTVIFSGDLTQTGMRKDFNKLDEILSEMWESFAKQGANPTFVVMPGNHDVEWLKEPWPAHEVLKEWWSFPHLHDDFFSGNKNPYRTAVEEQLQEFRLWLDRLAVSKIPTSKSKNVGLLPGDQSLTIQKGKLKLGLVLLNSTWLQIDGGEYLGKLHVDARQLQKVTNGSPASWCSKNDLNFLITHHYNQTRAIIELSQLTPTLGDKEMLQLMNAYYFLFNERMPSLFDRCHKALWDGFVSRGDAKNLISLFRYSSLNWRLRGREDNERKYIQRLVSDFGSALSIHQSERSPRELAYLKVRAGAAGLLSAPKASAVSSNVQESL